MIDDDLIDDASAVGRLLGTLRSMADEFFACSAGRHPFTLRSMGDEFSSPMVRGGDEFFACSVGRRPFTLRSMGDEFSSPTIIGDEKNDFVSRFSLELFSFYVFIL